MKILFVVGSLHMGGVERTVSKLANYWCAQGNDVAICTVSGQSSDFYDLDEKVARFPMDLLGPKNNLWQKIILLFKRLRALPRIIKSYQPDIILSFATDCNLLCLKTAWIHNVPIIYSERNNADMKKINTRLTLLRRLLYPFARQMTFVSQGVADSFPWYKGKKTVILNALEPVGPLPEGHSRDNSIIGLGRLVEAKGFDILINAFAKIAPQHPDWRLKIYGEGVLKPELQKQIDALGLEERIILAGYTKNSREVLQHAGIFVLSSHFEGFPNSLMEAMSAGAPCISFDCPSGPNEMITHKKDGLLVSPANEEKLSEALSYMLQNPKERTRIGNSALAINDRLSLSHVAQQWEKVINNKLNLT